MTGQTLFMADNKKPKGAKKSGGKPDEAYRKTFKPARIRKSIAEVATARAEELAQDFTQYVNDAVRMRLEQEGKWPPKPSDGQGKK